MVEIHAALRGYRQRLDDQYEMLAWHITHTVQPHVKKRLRVSDFWGRDDDEEEYDAPVFLDAASFDQYMQERIAKHRAQQAAAKRG